MAMWYYSVRCLHQDLLNQSLSICGLFLVLCHPCGCSLRAFFALKMYQRLLLRLENTLLTPFKCMFNLALPMRTPTSCFPGDKV